MPRQIPSIPVLRTLLKQQAKPTPGNVPSKKQIQHEKEVAKRAANPREAVEPRTTRYFRMGHNEVYFPTKFIGMLRPRPRDNPFLATFHVPTRFNKFDFRDYLHNIYGLTVKNVSSQLRYNKRKHSLDKYMRVEMDEPFVWPELPEDLSPFRYEHDVQSDMYVEERRMFEASDERRIMKSFDGLGVDKFPTIEPYVPKKQKSQLQNKFKKAQSSKDKIHYTIS
ncbi:mitochondrial 54S ribosomal protein uL23m [Dipodascopsis tothii]|uniref:mitochondrial 54S ribosomal protein uL23m n=1 Tax=Dipodascopsis tothii TaxID=44089 RepID=UPI0034CDC6A3